MCMLMNLRHTEEITYEMRFAAFCVCLKANIAASFLFLSYHPSFQKLYTVTYEYLVGIPYDDGASGQQNFVLLAH